MHKDTFLQACSHLQKCDPVMKRIIQHFGTEQRLQSRSSAMECLAQSIVGQQISTKAAAAIWQRLLQACGGECRPQAILGLSFAAMRETGLSRRKVEYIQNIAEFLQQTDIYSLENPQAELLKIKGIGQWTYDMFAIFHLEHLDVLPLGDLGLIRAVEAQYFAGNKSSLKEIAKQAVNWRPYRSIATWYLWRTTDEELVSY